MNFFEHQDKARHNTVRLVVLFGVAIAGIIITLYLSIALALFLGSRSLIQIGWDQKLFCIIATISSCVIAYGSISKWRSLSLGGHVVAAELGGQYLDPQTSHDGEQQLLNVVREVAIASGISTPDVFILKAESGINAFAAGLTPNQAVIGVTRGCLEQLDRDELQGVIAHEFSHILNGDMAINLRLMGGIHGIVMISSLGRMCLHYGGYGGGLTQFDPTALLRGLLGMALITVGSIGVLCSRMIKSSISRQREFLADASAVQFTRNPYGLASALNKIQNSAFESFVMTPQAEAASHLFFGDAIQRSWSMSSLLETHPPIHDRLRRLGVSPRMLKKHAQAKVSAEPSDLPSQQSACNPEALLAEIGTISQAQLDFSRMLLQQLPTALQGHLTSPEGSQAITLALFLDSDPLVQATQLQNIEVSPEQIALIRDILPMLAECDPQTKLPLIDWVMPALRQQTATDLRQLQQQTQMLQASKLVPPNLALPLILKYRLSPYLDIPKPPATEFTTIQQVWPDCVTVLSTLAIAGQKNPANQLYVLREGLTKFQAPQRQLPEQITPPDIQGLEESLKRLEQATPKLKQQIVNICTQTALINSRVTLEESELLRAIVIALGCPMPPMLMRLRVSANAG